ncbi:hypothetical protein PV328_000059 [Microctonus aethiopoides]|uniref:AAA-ATPase-like domain-containing protein n=1 Tax=Microctonus aethiopoides TaxID=144406 RepID=A0AA39FU31_9HYME|nr:hypothetical protein PV328_000059 [Microctonus aethiopoides]
MELRSTKRRKMSEDESNESTPTSSDIEDSEEPNETFSTFDHHYNDPFYVDKTLLIKKLLKVNHVLIIAPSRFGKSLNMDMVKRFVEIECDEKGNPIELKIDEAARRLKKKQPQSKNYELFKGKKIFREKEIMYKHFGKYPTICADFGGVQGSNFEQILDSLRTVVHRAYQKHDYLLKADLWNREAFVKKDFMDYFNLRKSKLRTVEEIKTGLVLLSKFLHAHYGRRVFVFIDEFDVPVNRMVYKDRMDSNDREDTIELLQVMIRDLLKGSDDFVERSLSNACQQLGGILSGSANNVRLCSFMQKHSFVEFYGFHKDEVKDLLKRAGLSDHLNEVTAMYNGYKKILKNGDVIEISSPWAIMQYVLTTVFDIYWSAGIPKQIKAAIGNSKIRSKIADIMMGKCVEIKYCKKLEIQDIEKLNKMICRIEIDEQDVNLFLQFLLEMAFFYPSPGKDKTLQLNLPNESVRTVLNDILYKTDFIKKYFDHSPVDIKNFTDSAEICDIVIIIGDYMLIIKIKHFRKSAPDAYAQVLDNKYCTLSEKASVEKAFPTNTPNVEGHIPMRLHRDKDGEISITYSLKDAVVVNYVVQEAIVVIKDIFRKYPNKYESKISTLCENLDKLDELANADDYSRVSWKVFMMKIHKFSYNFSQQLLNYF